MHNGDLWLVRIAGNHGRNSTRRRSVGLTSRRCMCTECRQRLLLRPSVVLPEGIFCARLLRSRAILFGMFIEWIVWSFLGLVIGSFLNVVILREGSRKSIGGRS